MGRKFSYSLRPGKKVTRVICQRAKINQDFLNEDVPALLNDLPSFILLEKKYQQKQDQIIRFRVSAQEKAEIERAASRQGFGSVSVFLRSLIAKQKRKATSC
jgi:hypothetical protein